MVAGDVGHGPDDLLRLEVAQVDPGDAAVHVVDEEPAPVVVAVRLGEGGVVGVAPGEVAQHLLRLVVEAVAGGGVGREHRDGRDVPPGGEAVHVHLPRVAARGEQVVLVQVARARRRPSWPPSRGPTRRRPSWPPSGRSGRSGPRAAPGRRSRRRWRGSSPCLLSSSLPPSCAS